MNPRTWDMIDNCNINSLTKNQVSAMLLSRAIRRSVLSTFTETSVPEFCYKSVNLSLEELKNNTVLLFPMQELFR